MSRFKQFKANVVANAPIFELIKKVFDVVVIVVAAVWTYRTFIHKETPSLEKTPRITSELSIDSFSFTKVNVNFYVHVKNIGKTSFDVTSIKIRYWLIPKDSIPALGYFSEKKYSDKHGAAGTILDSSLIAHYSPETEVEQGYDFIFDRDSAKAIMILADVEYSSGKSFSFEKATTWNDYTYQTKFRCIPEKVNSSSK
jgi:hypothetical protein